MMIFGKWIQSWGFTKILFSVGSGIFCGRKMVETKGGGLNRLEEDSKPWRTCNGFFVKEHYSLFGKRVKRRQKDPQFA